MKDNVVSTTNDKSLREGQQQDQVKMTRFNDQRQK